MCLIYSKQQTDRLAKQLKKGPVVAYKIVKLTRCGRGWVLRSLYHSRFIWQVGRNRSNRTHSRRPVSTDLVDHGIHVMASRPQAVKRASDSEIVMPVTCHLAHLVAANEHPERREAVFSEVTLSQQAYNKAKKEQ